MSVLLLFAGVVLVGLAGALAGWAIADALLDRALRRRDERVPAG